MHLQGCNFTLILYTKACKNSTLICWRPYMIQKQWKQNQRIQNQKIYNNRIKKAFLPVTLGLLAFMVMQGGCALPGNSGQDTTTQAAADTDESAVVDYTCIANQGSQEKIYVILKNYHGDYWKKVIQGVTKAAEQIDEAVYLGGIDNETDVSGQISLIEKAQQQGADGILLAPANSNALVESCQEIKNQNISLVLIDSSINSDAYDTCYMTGNMEAGQIAAREMLAMLSEQGNADQDPLEVGILLSSDSSQAMVNRVSGFLEYWAKYAPEKWTINQDIRLNGGDMENAQADVSELLRNNRHIKGLYGCNNTSTKGIATVLMRAARKDIVMAGFDLAEETASLIRDPDYHGITLLQKQEQMAYKGMLSLDQQIRGEKPEQKYIDTGVLLVDRDYLLENEQNE